ncbi:DUF3895 domain-containing protein [Oceanobacillus salinisoli]
MLPDVCSFLEILCEQGVLEFQGKQGGVDRVYQLKEFSL